MLEQEDLQQVVLVVKRKISMVHFLQAVNLKIEVVPEAQVSMAVLVVLVKVQAIVVQKLLVVVEEVLHLYQAR